MKLGLALVLALLSAAALNWGFYRQHEQASSLPPLSLRRPVRSLLSLFRNPRWLVGFAVGILGWAFYVAALAYGPLSLVQAASAGGIGILALLVWRFGGVALTRREWLGVGVSIGGLAVLGGSLIGSGGNTHHWGHHSAWSAVAGWLLVSGVLAAFFSGPGRRLVVPGAGLGIAAGFLYAAGDVGTKAAVAGGWQLLFVPALLAAHGLGFVTLQLAFQQGAALATAGVATLFTNAVPIAAGMALFHDPLPSGIQGALRVVAFTAVVAGAALLTRSTPDADSGLLDCPGGLVIRQRTARHRCRGGKPLRHRGGLRRRPSGQARPSSSGLAVPVGESGTARRSLVLDAVHDGHERTPPMHTAPLGLPARGVARRPSRFRASCDDVRRRQPLVHEPLACGRSQRPAACLHRAYAFPT